MRRPRATPSSARRARRDAATTSRATSTTCTASARPSATGSRQRSRRPEIGFAVYYRPPLHLQPALRYLGYSEGDFPETEKASRENLCLPLWAGITEEQQAEVVSVLKRASDARRVVIALPGQPAPGLAARLRRGPDRGGVAADVLPALRQDDAASSTGICSTGRSSRSSSRSSSATFVLFGFYNRWWRYVSTRDMWGAARGVTVASRARLPRALRVPARAHLAAAARGRRARLPAPARVRRRHAPARAHADRAAAGRARRPRQGGADRRRRRRGPADGARDAAQPAARTTRRSASSTTTRASAATASTACASSARPTSSRTCCATTGRTRC